MYSTQTSRALSDEAIGGEPQPINSCLSDSWCTYRRAPESRLCHTTSHHHTVGAWASNEILDDALYMLELCCHGCRHKRGTQMHPEAICMYVVWALYTKSASTARQVWWCPGDTEENGINTVSCYKWVGDIISCSLSADCLPHHPDSQALRGDDLLIILTMASILRGHGTDGTSTLRLVVLRRAYTVSSMGRGERGQGKQAPLAANCLHWLCAKGRRLPLCQ